MKQLTLRVDDELVEALKVAARQRGRSVNAFASLVLAAAVDPDTASDEVERVRARLERAGLLAHHSPAPHPRPTERELDAARRAVGGGHRPADLVSDERR